MNKKTIAVFLIIAIANLIYLSSKEAEDIKLEEKYEKDVQQLSYKIEYLELNLENERVKSHRNEQLVDYYEYEKELFDSFDSIPIKFMIALKEKDLKAMNELLNEKIEIRNKNGAYEVYIDNEMCCSIGNQSYEATSFTIHGFRYHEEDEMLFIYAQIIYEDNGEFVTPPTYIDLGFKVDDMPMYPMDIDWISRDV